MSMNRLTPLKQVLLEKGITQKEVARRTKLNTAIVSMIANGRYIPTEQQKGRIADAMQLPARQLFDE